jgi:hypothetical protein
MKIVLTLWTLGRGFGYLQGLPNHTLKTTELTTVISLRPGILRLLFLDSESEMSKTVQEGRKY